MAKTLLDEIKESFVAITAKIKNEQENLQGSMSHFQTDKYLESLIQSQRLLKKLSAQANNSMEELLRTPWGD